MKLIEALAELSHRLSLADHVFCSNGYDRNAQDAYADCEDYDGLNYSLEDVELVDTNTGLHVTDAYAIVGNDPDDTIVIVPSNYYGAYKCCYIRVK